MQNIDNIKVDRIGMWRFSYPEFDKEKAQNYAIITGYLIKFTNIIFLVCNRSFYFKILYKANNEEYNEL